MRIPATNRRIIPQTRLRSKPRYQRIGKAEMAKRGRPEGPVRRRHVHRVRIPRASTHSALEQKTGSAGW